MTGPQAAVELLVGHHSNGLFSCCNKLYRRSVLVAAGLERPRINLGEDQIFNLRVFRSAKGAVRGVAGHTYRYISRPGSIMRSVSERHVDDFFELWRERDEAAAALLKPGNAWRLYRRRKMLNVMDFAGLVFRSGSRPLVQRLDDGLRRMAIPPALPWTDAVAVMRWVKWRLRMALGVRGRFPAWLR